MQTHRGLGTCVQPYSAQNSHIPDVHQLIRAEARLVTARSAITVMATTPTALGKPS